MMRLIDFLMDLGSSINSKIIIIEDNKERYNDYLNKGRLDKELEDMELVSLNALKDSLLINVRKIEEENGEEEYYFIIGYWDKEKPIGMCKGQKGLRNTNKITQIYKYIKSNEIEWEEYSKEILPNNLASRKEYKYEELIK